MPAVSKTAVLGIDLGTTNSAISVWRAGHDAPRAVEIPQIASVGRIERRSVLPSFLYIPHDGELKEEEARLPWEEHGDPLAISGSWARERGALAPERLIASAKSWLANRHVDRQASILPWHSELATGKRSPVDASAQYLKHLLAAFAHDARLRDEDPSLAACEVILTVPASFDEAARELTQAAAFAAGLAQPVLLEEPLAAFYAWLDQAGDAWRRVIKPGDLVLVCDVGGGTTDFSLIAVDERGGRLALERLSVGDHLLLGGDNMDLALAYALKGQLEQGGKRLDHWQFLSLVSTARAAKERFFSDPSVDVVPIAVASRGASLLGGTLTTTLTRAMAEATVGDGFFPLTEATTMPAARRGVGLQEFGLAYEADAGISRHLARFLKRSLETARHHPTLAKPLDERVAAASSHGLLMPTAVLFNGGVFKAPLLRQRILDLLTAWNGGEAVRALTESDPELAVAHGAAVFGRLRSTGEGIRIRAGTARSYYIGVESAQPAVPGIKPPVHGLCLVPQGTEEGTEIELAERQFGLLVGEPAEFRFFSSTGRAGDGVGTVIDDAAQTLDETSKLMVTLPSEGLSEGDVVPVRLDAVVTDIGTLQLFMKEATGPRRWRLELDVRGQDA